jgi:hypothetical protein
MRVYEKIYEKKFFFAKMTSPDGPHVGSPYGFFHIAQMGPIWAL